MSQFEVKSPVRHDNIDYKIGEVIRGISDEAGKLLVEAGAAIEVKGEELANAVEGNEVQQPAAPVAPPQQPPVAPVQPPQAPVAPQAPVVPEAPVQPNAPVAGQPTAEQVAAAAASADNAGQQA